MIRSSAVFYDWSLCRLVYLVLPTFLFSYENQTFLLSVLCRRFPLQRQLIHSRQLSVTQPCQPDPKKNPVMHKRTVKAKFNLFNLHLIPLYYILTGVRESQPGSALKPDFITQLLVSVVYWYQDGLSRSNKWLDWRRKTQVQGLLFSDTHYPKAPWECHVESWSSYSYKTFSHLQASELYTKKNQLLTSLSVFNLQECQHVQDECLENKSKESGGRHWKPLREQWVSRRWAKNLKKPNVQYSLET